jgi:hypothetical protein
VSVDPACSRQGLEQGFGHHADTTAGRHAGKHAVVRGDLHDASGDDPLGVEPVLKALAVGADSTEHKSRGVGGLEIVVDLRHRLRCEDHQVLGESLNARECRHCGLPV